MSTSSYWSTNKRYGWAQRALGQLTVIRHRDSFVLLGQGSTHLPQAVNSLEDAISYADKQYPPDGWEFAFGLWLREGWKVTPSESGWQIFDQEGTLMSSQYFDRADLARKWCEIRQDRVGINLRGPKPKSKYSSAP